MTVRTRRALKRLPVIAREGGPAPALASVADTFAGLFSFNERLITGYTGPLFRVRDATSAVETDIGYIPGTNQINTVALAAACPGHNGFVVTLYDQSGNGRNIAMSTTTKQPKIYDSVTGLLTLGPNGAAAALFDNTDDELTRADAFGISGDVPWTIGAVWSTANTSAFAAAWWVGAVSGQRALMRQNNSATQLAVNYSGGQRVFTCTALNTIVNNTLTRRTTGEAIGGIPLMQNGVDLTELSATNPATVPQMGNTASSAGFSSGGFSGALNGKWSAGFVSAAKWSDAGYTRWNAFSTARYGT